MSNQDMPETREYGVTQSGGASRVDAGLVAQVGALASAIVASACCWLPLLLIAVGVSGGAVSAMFEAWRPVLLPLTFALLGAAFYFTYRRPKGACCAVPSTESKAEACRPPAAGGVFTLKRVNMAMLWVVTVFVLAFAFFPNYVGYFLGGGGTLAARAGVGNHRGQFTDQGQWTLAIEGMTCEGCAAGLQSKLAKVPGVSSASVSFEQGRALVTADPSVREEALREAVSAAGYTVTSSTKDGQATKTGGRQ